jgi:hypothetical protein
MASWQRCGAAGALDMFVASGESPIDYNPDLSNCEVRYARNAAEEQVKLQSIVNGDFLSGSPASRCVHVVVKFLQCLRVIEPIHYSRQSTNITVIKIS